MTVVLHPSLLQHPTMSDLSGNPAFHPPNSVVLGTLATSEVFTPYVSPHKSAGPQNQHIEQLASLQNQQYDHTYSPSPHSGQLDYQQPLAGPSTYRASAVVSSPLSAPNGSLHPNGRYTAASVPHAGRKANGEAKDMKQYQVEDDGRIGVDAPCE